MALRDLKRGGEAVDVAALLDSSAQELICELVGAGTLVSLSTTRDGGALGVTVTLDGEWVREYFRESEEAIEWLKAVMAEVQSEIDARPASSERGTGQRRRKRP